MAKTFNQIRSCIHAKFPDKVISSKQEFWEQIKILLLTSKKEEVKTNSKQHVLRLFFFWLKITLFHMSSKYQPEKALTFST